VPPRNRQLEREWTARRSTENRLWAKANTSRDPATKKGGLHISGLLKLNRMVAEDIREIRAHGLGWFSTVCGRAVTNAERESILRELEAVYNRTELGLAHAEEDMKQRGIAIPRVFLERHLAPIAVDADTPAPEPLGGGADSKNS
jgi:hypothetical protein